MCVVRERVLESASQEKKQKGGEEEEGWKRSKGRIDYVCGLVSDDCNDGAYVYILAFSFSILLFFTVVYDIF